MLWKGIIMCCHPFEQIVKARDKRKDMTVATFIDLILLHMEGQNVAAPEKVADVVELRRKIVAFEGEL